MIEILLLGFKIVISFIFQKKKKISNDEAVFITGCDTGIGHELSKYLHKIGFTVISGCLDKTEGYRILKELGCKCILIDISKEESVKNAQCEVEKYLEESNKKLYAIINNAGIFIYGEFDWYTMEQCENIVAVNLLGTLRVTKHFLHLVINSKGRIINVGSINSIFTFRGISVYSATKYAIKAFTDVIKMELKKFGVKVVLLMPGDHTRLTSLLNKQEDHYQNMLLAMDKEKKNRCFEYLNQSRKSSRKYFGKFSSKSFEDSKLFKDIEYVLLDNNPSDIITAPLKYKIIYYVIAFIPEIIRKNVFIILAKLLDFELLRIYS